MSTFSLTKGSAAALGMLTSQAGSETLLLTQPARELRAELSIEPFTGDSGDQLLAVLFMREQRHSMTLQRNDGANAQHLADWVEAVANGTLDTAQAIPQRQPVLLPCCRCEGVAIAYSYLAPAPAQHDLHGVKCRHRDCQSLEGAATAAAAADAWNAIQREELAEAAEPAPAQDERKAFEAWAKTQGDKWLIVGGLQWSAGTDDYASARTNAAWAAWQERAARPAQTEQQPTYVECHECTECGHAGINDQADGDSACSHCLWHGPSPDEDKCPECQREWTMSASCPQCGCRYRLIAGADIAAPIAQTAPDGWQLVPMEPTQAMREAFHAATERYEDGHGESPDSQWHAMLRAAPALSPTA